MPVLRVQYCQDRGELVGVQVDLLIGSRFSITAKNNESKSI